MEVEDLKRKAARLTEQVSEHAQDTTLKPLIPRVDLAENQIIRWRYRLPDMASDLKDDNDPPMATVVSPVEVREELQTFQDAVRRKVAEIREVITTIEERMNILRRAREDAWELVTDRVASELGHQRLCLST